MASSNANSLQLYLRLLRYVKPYWVPFALSIAGMVVMAATEPAFPALLKPLLDGSFVQKEGGLLAWLPVLIVAVFVLVACGVAVYRRLALRPPRLDNSGDAFVILGLIVLLMASLLLMEAFGIRAGGSTTAASA